MRSMPLVLGFLLGLAAATFTGCPTSTCSPANCALGCCDASGRCQLSSSSTCGTKGGICATCRIDESCVTGTCMSSSSSGAGAAGGGTSGTGGGSAGTGTYPAFLDSFTSAYCAKVIECGQLPNGAAADCAAVFRPYVAGSGLGGFATERGVRIGASTFDAVKAQACLAELANTTCGSSGPQGSAPSCNQVTHPAAAPNAACDSAGDCSDKTTSCNGASCMRRCTLGGGMGEPCRSTGVACDAPFVCINSRCGVEPVAGTPCEQFSSSCGPNAECRNNVCERLPTAGQACPNFVCVATAYCDSTRVCRAKKTLGTTCGSNSECEATAICRTVCTAKGTPGASCRFDTDCVETASCFEGACRTRGAVGARCIDYADCASNTSCDTVLRTCQTYSSEVLTGQPCSSTQNCKADGERCRGLVVNADGGVGTRGSCGLPMVGDACPFGSECGAAQYCDMAERCQAAGPSTPCQSSTNCRATDFCSSTTRTCTPKVATGQPCTDGNSCVLQAERCIFGADGGMGRCGTSPVLGQSCTGSCGFPFACVNGTCVMAGHIGEPCTPSGSPGCITGACVRPDGGVGYAPEARCVAPLPNGSPCEGANGCQSNSCDRANTRLCVAACN